MRLSVIIPSLNGLASLERCVASLRAQTCPPDELVIVDSTPDQAASRLDQFPGLIREFLEKPTGVPAMRSLGLSLTNGDVVAMTEDHCLADPEWCEMVRKLHQEYDEEVIGGAVENGATDTLLDWAAYFCEYLDFMTPLTLAPGGPVPGNNVSYKRSVLLRCGTLFEKGWWEFFLHRELARHGVKFRMNPASSVRHCKSFSAGEFQEQSLLFARSFAAMRSRRTAPFWLWAYRLLSPVLPLLKTFRLMRTVFTQKRRHRREFLQALPWILWFQICWSAGEITGYWLGDGGSTERVH